MKHLLSMGIIAFSFFGISCNSSKADPPVTSSGTDSTVNVTAERNKTNTNLVYRGIESGDLSKMDGFVAAGIVDHGMRADVKGLDSVKKMLADIHNHFTNYKMEMIADATNGDYHFTLVKSTGVTKDNSMGMPANTNFSSLSAGVERIADGKVQEHWRFIDPSEMMKMMEHMPMRTAAHK